MVVDINKIIVNDRIRKDFGNIQELADDIQENGLITPPTVNKNYELLAGERRLRACKLLGWPQIEVRMMDTRDAEHELNIEISENEVRKEFSKSERANYMRRLFRIEEAKAKERQGERTSASNNAEVIRADETTAKQFNISATTLRKELAIADNKEMFSADEFAEWDEGRLSTNKAFQMLKRRQKEIEDENEKLRSALSESETTRISEKRELERQLEERPVVEREVAPPDYEQLKRETKSLRGRYDEMSEKWKKAESEKQSLLNELHNPENERAETIKKSALLFCAGVSNFIEKYGGYIWLTEEINNMGKAEREGYIRAINAIDAWVNQMKGNLNV